MCGSNNDQSLSGQSLSDQYFYRLCPCSIQCSFTYNAGSCHTWDKLDVQTSRSDIQISRTDASITRYDGQMSEFDLVGPGRALNLISDLTFTETGVFVFRKKQEKLDVWTLFRTSRVYRPVRHSYQLSASMKTILKFQDAAVIFFLHLTVLSNKLEPFLAAERITEHLLTR